MSEHTVLTPEQIRQGQEAAARERSIGSVDNATLEIRLPSPITAATEAILGQFPDLPVKIVHHSTPSLKNPPWVKKLFEEGTINGHPVRNVAMTQPSPVQSWGVQSWGVRHTDGGRVWIDFEALETTMLFSTLEARWKEFWEERDTMNLAEWRKTWIGRRVTKGRKPFKSRLKVNTVKDIINHPILNRPAFTFFEDDSYVECRRCYLAEGKNEQESL